MRFSLVVTAALVLGVAFAGWSTFTNIQFATSSSAQLESTVEMYEANGDSVTDALAEPSGVTEEEDGTRHIDNPLRYDFDNASAAHGTLTPSGGYTNAISLMAFLVIPFAAFSLGILQATHDVNSGSIVVRWPATGLGVFVISKLLAGTALIAVTIGVTAIGALAAGALGRLWRPAVAGFDSLPVTTVELPAFGLALAGVALLVGVAFLTVGLAIGSLTRMRTVPIAAFGLVYFLLPIIGTFDPRNLIPVAGGNALQIVGAFRPSAVGELPQIAGIIGLAAVALVSLAVTAWAWVLRARTPALSTS